MKRKYKLVISLVGISLVGIPIVLVFLLYFVSYMLSTHTEYCPFSHRIHDLAKCVVLDRSSDTVLIQHAELDINIYYFELRKAKTSFYFELPDTILELAPSGYTARLIPGDSSSILINGHLVHLKPTNKLF